jgi:DNA polymerase-1
VLAVVQEAEVRTGICFDTETELIEPGRLAPPLVCLSVADATDSYELFHHTDSREVVDALLEGDDLLVGDNVAFDFSVFAAKWPDLLPLIFEVYDADRVSDTEVREKLIHIARGVYRGFMHVGDKVEKLNYSLADLARRHLNKELKKGDWQLRFGELMNTPLDWWPADAREYAITDAVVTLEIWQKQEEDLPLLGDEFRQTRAAFWLQLMSCWGMIADPAGVREFARKTQQKYDAIAEDLIVAGLMRKDGTRDTKATQRRVVAAYVQKALEELGADHNSTAEFVLDVQRNAFGRVSSVRNNIIVNGVQAKTFIEMTGGGKTGKHQPKTDEDVCKRSGDHVLEQYAELSSLKKTLSTDIPLLNDAVVTPLKVRYESLLSTGRTASTPNVQNLPTEVGVRECFRPRPGHIYAVSDYSQFELRTWSQVCLKVLGQSRMAEAINNHLDCHIEIARRILGIPYDEALADYRHDPHGRVYKPRQAGKAGNFGFPGGLGAKSWRHYARKNYGVDVTEDKAFEIRGFWEEAWPESQPYFDWVNSQVESPFPLIKQLFVERYRGDVSFTEAANGMFQSLAADAAKAAGFLIARACYVETDSPLFGSRPVNFVHDEFVVEVLDDERAHDRAVELARLMCVGAEPFLPDVPPEAEPLLCRKWSKSAKAVRDENDRLVPWDFPVKEAA